MPTATELLSTEACDDILVVDLESRSIIIPKTVSVLGVEADDETRILHFKIPRYYCEVDLSEFAIRVNYRNANNESDMYIVTHSEVNDEFIKFDWVVGRHAFAKKGSVAFSVCLKDMFEGIVRREFNTRVATLPVLEGLETGNDLASEHTDIFEQLREELFNNTSNESASSTNFLGDNPTGGVDNDTVDTWLALGCGFAWISELDQVNSQPSQYGFIINYTHNIDVFQIFQDQMNGDTYLRCGDQTASWLQSWRRITAADSYDHINVSGVHASEMVSVSGSGTSMAMYTNGIGDGSGNMWIDQSGEVWFKAAYASDKKLATEEYVDAAIANAIAKLG